MDGEEAEAKEFQSRLESLLVSWKSIFVRSVILIFKSASRLARMLLQ